MKTGWEDALERWSGAGLIDAPAAERIREFESAHARPQGPSWMRLAAFIFGGILLASGAVLLISAGWYDWSPVQQSAALAGFVFVLHAAGVAVRHSTASAVLHAAGTLAFIAAVNMIAEIWGMSGHWSGAARVWAAGVVVAYAVRPDALQLAIASVFVPVWLIGEWYGAVRVSAWPTDAIPAAGAYLLALTYLTAHRSQALKWIGAIAVIPCAAWTAAAGRTYGAAPDLFTQAIGWNGAVLLPLAVAAFARRGDLFPNVVAACGAVLIALSAVLNRTPLPYVACAANAAALVWWGVRERRPERINLGLAGFALAVLAFFASDVMNKLGRATGLLALGVLFMAGGWYIERFRRRLLRRVQ
jgi:uncharacterized membrane protein